MKTRIATLATAAVLGAFLGAGGCADDRASIQVQYVCSPPDDCDFTGGCAQFIGYLGLDRALNTSGVMDVYLKVANQLPPNAVPQAGQLNSNDAHVDEVVVAYQGAVGGESSSGLNNFVAAGKDSVVKVPLVLGGSTAGEVIASVRMRGYYENGSRFETGDFPITIAVCSGTGCASSGAACLAGTCPPAQTGISPLTCLK